MIHERDLLGRLIRHVEVILRGNVVSLMRLGGRSHTYLVEDEVESRDKRICASLELNEFRVILGDKLQLDLASCLERSGTLA